MDDAKVNISRSARYQILATERFHAKYGKLISRTEVDGQNSAVSVYDSGTVVILCRGKTLCLDLGTGQISYA